MYIDNKNLIADDFSDFTPFQGAIVTRNKTFPIEVFKGGRNYLLNSDERVDFEEQDVIPTTVGEYLPTEGGRNLAILKYLVVGYLSDGNGNVVASQAMGERTTDFIEIDNTSNSYLYSIERLKETPYIAWNGYCLYDVNKVSLGIRQASYGDIELGNRQVTKVRNDGIYANAKYLRVSSRGLSDNSFNIKLEKGDTPTDWIPAPEDFNNLKGKSYALSQPLRKENILSLNGSFEEDDFIGLWLGDDKFVGFLDNQELTFDLTENYDDEFVVVKTLSEKGVIDNAKLEKGAVATEYSPAPEDGYGLDLPNGAYHIQTSGGSNRLKMFKYISSQNLKTSSVDIKAFDRLLVQNNGLDTKELLPAERFLYKSEGIGNRGINFSGVQITDSLDFIASDPFIGLYQPILDILSETTLDYDVSRIKVNGEELRVSEVKMTAQGSIYTSNAVMLEAKVRGDYRDLRTSKLNYSRDLKHPDVDNNAIQTLDYGTFIVLETEYDTSSAMTTLICYDLMVATQQEYEELPITYPTTVHTLLTSLANACNLELDTNTYKGSNLPVNADYWVNASYTYRDVLDHIAQMTANTIKIKNDKLHVFELEETNIKLNNFASLKIGDKYGKTNIMNISQEPQHYNKFSPANANEIEDKKELVFSNNPIFTDNMQYWADTLLPQVKDITYNTAEFKTYQGGIFQVGDIVQVFNGEEYEEVVITQQVFNSNNVQVDLVSSLPFSFKSDYVVETDIKRQGQTTYFIVDQQNGIIQGLVNRIDDLTDQTASLTIRVDSIETQVSTVNLGNIIGNANGSEGYAGWSGTGILLGVSDLIGYPDLTSTMTAIPKFIAGSLSEFGWEFFTSGQMISTFGYISGLTYSFKAKIGNFKPCIITVYEYKADKSVNGTIVKQFNNPQSYIQFTDNLKNDTVYVKLGIEFPTATPSSRPNISEIMYNKGEPKDWFETPLDAIMFAESSRRQLSNRITDTVTEIDKVSGDIHNTTVDITARDGVVIKNNNGKGLTILNDNDEEVISLNADGDIISLKMTAIDMVTENMVANNINAVSGDIGKFHLENGTLVYTTPEYNRPYTQADKADMVSIVRALKTPNAYDMYIYDFNNDGVINSEDMATLQRHFMGIETIIKPIKSRVIIGTLDGKITTQVLYGANDTVGASFTMQAERLSGMLVDTQALATNSMLFNGQEVYVDGGYLRTRNV